MDPLSISFLPLRLIYFQTRITYMHGEHFLFTWKLKLLHAVDYFLRPKTFLSITNVNVDTLNG